MSPISWKNTHTTTRKQLTRLSYASTFTSVLRSVYSWRDVTYISLIPESFLPRWTLVNKISTKKMTYAISLELSWTCPVHKAHFDDIVNFVESANDPPDRGYVIRSVFNTFLVSVSNVSFMDTYDSFLTLSDMTIFHKTSPDKHKILAVQIRVAVKKVYRALFVWSIYVIAVNFVVTRRDCRSLRSQIWPSQTMSRVTSASKESVYRTSFCWTSVTYKCSILDIMDSLSCSSTSVFFVPPAHSRFKRTADVLRRKKSEEDTDRYT